MKFTKIFEMLALKRALGKAIDIPIGSHFKAYGNKCQGINAVQFFLSLK